MAESGIRKTAALLRSVRQPEISVHAAYACYFMMLSVFPTLVLLLGMLRYTALGAADLMDLLSGFLPTALQPYAWNIIAATYSNTSAAVVSLSALTALWSASKGIYGLMKGLNAVYGIPERRRWLHVRILCVVYMVLFLVVLLLTLVVHVFGSTIAAYLRLHTRAGWILGEVLNLRFFVLVAVQTVLFDALYMYLPGHNHGFRESLPGALFSSLGWMGVSAVFTVYVENFTRYTSIFGSVYAVALSMLWLYVCVSMVFYGAVLNRILVKKAE